MAAPHSATARSLTRTIKQRMLLLAVAAMALTGGLWIYSEYDMFQATSQELKQQHILESRLVLREEVTQVLDYISYQKSTTDTRLRRAIRDRVDEAHAIASHLYKLNIGPLGPKRTQDLIREALRPIRFNSGRGYYFATDIHGVEQLMPVRPEMEHSNILNLRDPSGRSVVKDLIDIAATKGEGFYSYLWPKPGKPASPEPKIAYVKLFQPLGWILGTGEYLENVEQVIKAETLDRIERIRFDETGYVFALDMHGIMLANGAEPSLAGRSMNATTDEDGRPLIPQVIRAATSPGGGFLRYVWEKPAGPGRYPKLTYFLHVPQWNWILGAGVYLDDLDSAMVAMEADLRADIRDRVLTIGAIMAVLLISITIIVRVLTARLNSSFAALTNFFREAASGAAYIDPDAMVFDEFRQLAAPANEMVRERSTALAELAKAHSELEERVRTKTAKLRQMNNDLLQREELLRVTFNSTGDGLLVTDTADYIIKTNPRFHELWGIPPSDAPSGFSVRRVRERIAEQLTVPPQWPRPTATTVDAALFDELICTDGRIIERATYPLVNADATLGTIYNFRDITEKRRAEGELSRLRLLLGNIVDSMPSVLVAVDEFERIIQWNRAAQDYTGIDMQGALGEKLDDILPAMAGHMPMVRHAIHQKEPQHTPRLVHVADGEQRFYDITAYPLGTETTSGAVIRIDDVTERVRIEDMILESEKMVSLGGLAAGMAHEINNPLGAILQSNQNIIRRLSPNLPANAKAARATGVDLEAVSEYLHMRRIPTYLEGIAEAGNRAATIVRNMLDFSRRNDTNKRPYHLSSILDDAVELASKDYQPDKQYDFRNITIQRDYDADVPLVHVSRTEIEQVFLNLLKNAGQALATKSFENDTPRITLRISHDSERVRVEVEDNGPGMDAALKRRVFEPFYTTKEAGAGTGLGLSVSYFIVTRNHGGEFRVDSQPGEWTRFTITLPVGGE